MCRGSCTSITRSGCMGRSGTTASATGTATVASICRSPMDIGYTTGPIISSPIPGSTSIPAAITSRRCLQTLDLNTIWGIHLGKRMKREQIPLNQLPSLLLVNGQEARKLINATSDPIIRELLETASGIAFLQFLMTSGMTKDKLLDRLPIEPFDMLFYLRLVKVLFMNKDGMKRLLDGDLSGLHQMD